MTDTLAIGPYADTDAAALRQEFDARLLARPDEIDSLSERERAAIRGLAYLGGAPFGADQMQRLPNLTIIANFGVGYDAIDVAAASARGIRVTNTPDVLNDDVADLAVGLLIALNRRFESGAAHVRSGGWAAQGELALGRKVSGRRIGILGMGRIGREIADRLAAFKADIHYQSRQSKDTPPGWTYHADPVDLAASVNDLVIAIVGGPATQGLVDARVLGALGPDGVVVNISRGSVIDEEALIAALNDGTICGAALDVFRGEPRVDERLVKLDNLFPLPHIGSATVETRAAMGALQRRNLRAGLEGQEPETPVN
ncbi:MAG: 2-hydroxyacid dehydrogenase [Paracoccus sp. (in: a-proteobacteria)]